MANNRVGEMTVDQPNVSAIAALPNDLAIMKMENDSIMALAAARPRDLEKIRNGLDAVLKAFPVLADEAIYNKPVGKDPDTGQQKYARNLSIRTAEVMAEAYGFNRVYTDVEILPDGQRVKVTATFTDYQQGRMWQDSSVLSMCYRARNGQMVKIAEDRFFNVTVKAEKSKVAREAILRCVNAGLKAWFFDRCEKMLDALLDDKTVDRIVGQFSTKGISLLQLETLVGRPRKQGWTGDDRKNLLGVWNAIKDGETSLDELFGPKAEDKSQVKPPVGGVTGADLAGAKASNGAATKDEKKPESAADEDPPKKTQPPNTDDAQLALADTIDDIQQDIDAIDHSLDYDNVVAKIEKQAELLGAEHVTTLRRKAADKIAAVRETARKARKT